MTVERLADAPLILSTRAGAPTTRCAASCASARSPPGVKLEPQIEVEYVTAALELAARGLGDTLSSRQMIRSRGSRPRLDGRLVRPAAVPHFAFITRRNAHLSPAVREFMRLAEKRVESLQRRL